MSNSAKSDQKFVKGPNSSAEYANRDGAVYGIKQQFEAIPPDASGTLGENAAKGRAQRQRSIDIRNAAISRVHPMDVSARSKEVKPRHREVKQ